MLQHPPKQGRQAASKWSREFLLFGRDDGDGLSGNRAEEEEEAQGKQPLSSLHQRSKERRGRGRPLSAAGKQRRQQEAELQLPRVLLLLVLPPGCFQEREPRREPRREWATAATAATTTAVDSAGAGSA